MRISSTPQIVLGLVLLAIPATATASDWSWNFTPYAWTPTIGVDVKVDDRTIFDRNVSIGNVIDDLDFAFFAHLEGRRGKLGVFADAVVGDFGDEPRNFSLGPLPITAESDLELTLIDVGGVWYPSEDGGFGIHYGVRLIDIDQELDIRGVGSLPADRRIIELARTEVDGLVGFRYLSQLAESWSFAFAADYSAGGSDGSWGTWLVLGYHFGSDDRYGFRFGYRHLEIELGDEDRSAKVETDIEFTGPVQACEFAGVATRVVVRLRAVPDTSAATSSRIAWLEPLNSASLSTSSA